MHTEFLVVGAGIAGLAIAWHLHRAGRSVRVLEAAPRTGGTIRTVHHGEILLEQGPQSLRGAGLATARLVDEMGLGGRVVEASPASNQRFVLVGARLRALPSGPGGLLAGGALKRRAVARLLLEPLQPRGPAEGESIDAFVRRRFGPHIAYPLIDAFIAGIYAGDATRTEAVSAFPELVEAEQAHGSVLLGMMRRERPERPDGLPRGAFTFDGGVEVLPRAIHDRLGEVVRTGVAVHEVVPDGGRVRVVADDGEHQAEHVIVCTPPRVAARQVAAWRDALAEVPVAPVAAIHLGWPEGRGPRMDGFGWLAPSKERSDVLGAIWVSSTFPHLAPHMDLLRVMVGGSRAPFLTELSERALADHALEVVRQVQGHTSDPELVQVAVHKPGIPQYVVGHAARRRAVESALQRVHPLSWGLTGIGLSQGLQAAEDLASHLIGRPPHP